MVKGKLFVGLLLASFGLMAKGEDCKFMGAIKKEIRESFRSIPSKLGECWRDLRSGEAFENKEQGIKNSLIAVGTISGIGAAVKCIRGFSVLGVSLILIAKSDEVSHFFTDLIGSQSNVDGDEEGSDKDE